jgi:hypothetical protein
MKITKSRLIEIITEEVHQSRGMPSPQKIEEHKSPELFAKQMEVYHNQQVGPIKNKVDVMLTEHQRLMRLTEELVKRINDLEAQIASISGDDKTVRQLKMSDDTEVR